MRNIKVWKSEKLRSRFGPWTQVDKTQVDNEVFKHFKDKRWTKHPVGYTWGTYNGKLDLLHRHIWRWSTGCDIPKGYIIHHRDENKLNNQMENLELMSSSRHAKLHRLMEYTKR